MQFFENGYRFGEPDLAPSSIGTEVQGELPDDVDVLIVGSGPAGSVLAAQLAAFPGIQTRIVERREGPLELGQADGVACRTVEMFEAFGLAQRLIAEAYWVNETVFWRPDEQDRTRIVRTGRVQDVEDGLSEFPHVIVNQARLQQFLLDRAVSSARRLVPDYGWEAVLVDVPEAPAEPVSVLLRRADGTERTVRAKYVVGCDGARSNVRRSIGRELVGDPQNHAWGVIDVLATTNFPDYRFKAAIQGGNGKNILIIPREGGYMVRLYVDIGKIRDDNRAEIRAYTAQDVIEVARSVFAPYTLDVQDVVWFSVYEVGQRVTDGFDDVSGRTPDRDPRVFIAGDACHTHSAKAGQGMNVSMQDAFNLGWKLGAVLEGRSPTSLLATYSAERQPVAQGLIDFDKEWSAMMAAGPRDPEHPERGGVDPAELQAYFVQSGRFTAGVATHYPPALLVGGGEHQALATGFPIGMRFHSAPVIRVADAKPVHLGHAARADGAWRLYAFADATGGRMAQLCEFLGSGTSPIVRFTRRGGEPDSVIDLRGIYQQSHRELPYEKLPAVLRPKKGKFGLTDYEKVYAPDLKNGPDVFDLRGIDRDRGALVVVRPDQFVADILPLDAHDKLIDFFEAFMQQA